MWKLDPSVDLGLTPPSVEKITLFSPAYRRTLETGVSVTDDVMMSDDFTQPGILVIVWEPEHYCLVS